MVLLLGASFLVIPFITVLVMMLAWPTKDVYKSHSTRLYTTDTTEEEFAKPTGIRLFWLCVIVGIGAICYGTQMNWIFNMPSKQSPALFDEVTHNLFEGYGTHLKELEDKKPPTRTDLPTELRRYELISYNPPKHFYVTIEDVKTHSVFNRVYVSKHCNSAATNKIGDEYNIRVTPYTMSNEPGVVYYEFHDLYEVFCGG